MEYEEYEALHILEEYAQKAEKLCEMAKVLEKACDYLLDGWKKSLRTVIHELTYGEAESAKLYAEVELAELNRRENLAEVKTLSEKIGWEDEA